MKKLLIIFLCCILPLISAAQMTASTFDVKGVVMDSLTNKSLGYVTVTLVDAATSLAVRGTLTKDDGSFVLHAEKNKTLQVVFAFVGYKSKVVNLNNDGVDLDLGKIILNQAGTQLKEVSINAARPLMKQEVDRITYDAQNDPERRTLSVLDMIRKVPLLGVDASDNILLRGNGNFKILLNGKESALLAKNPSDILRAMPAANIERIEVITTPPAKYDAEGLGGLINIITKKNADQGYNIDFTGRYTTVIGPVYHLDGTYKEGKFGVAFFSGWGTQKQPTLNSASTQNIFANETTISQSGDVRRTGNFHFGGIDLSYEIDTLNLLTGAVDYYGNNVFLDNRQLSSIDVAGLNTQSYQLQNNSNSSFGAFDAAINYQLGFKSSKERMLTLSYKYSHAPDRAQNDNLFTHRVSYPPGQFPDYNQQNNSYNQDHTFQLDFARPLSKKMEIEMGAKAILRTNSSNYQRDDFDYNTQQYLPNSGQSNIFNYRQDVYSVYNSYQVKLEKWTAKGGLRLEHTDINADFVSAGVSAAPGYANLMPSVAILRSFKTSSISVGYTQRIKRPAILQLNPFIDRSNPLYVSTGNPALRPELSNTFELNYSNFTKNSFNAGLSYAFSNNSIQTVSSLQAESVGGKADTVTFNTYQNLGSNTTLGLNVSTNLQITKRFSLGINGQLNRLWLKGIFNGKLYENQGFKGNLFGNTRYKLNNGYALAIVASYFSGGVYLQGKSSSFIASTFVFSRDFLHNRATVVFAANNPFTKYRISNSTTTSVDFYQSSSNQNYGRSFAIRCSLVLGKLKSEIKKSKHVINNDDVKGGGNNGGGS